MKKNLWVGNLCLLPLRDMEIPLANLISALSAVDNVLTQTMTTHNISLSEMTAMASPDRPGTATVIKRVWCWQRARHID